MREVRRPIGPFSMPAIGLGCMNLSHAYGQPLARAEAERILQRALELGITHFDTAALYGFGNNEVLLGRVLKPYRNRVLLATKCGLTGIAGKRVLDGRPQSLVRDCNASLRHLKTEVIDLLYLHRWDKRVPIEDSIGALSRLVEAGKVRAIGLSEVSADTLRKAHGVHPVSAVQSEYSVWTRNPEVAVLDACAELGVAFVAFSPLARGFLADMKLDPESFVDKDLRRKMPRFQDPHFTKNRRLLAGYAKLAAEAGCSPAQLALAWLLQRSPIIHVIPGTRSPAHLEENLGAAEFELDSTLVKRLDGLINQTTVSGARYNVATLAEIDTEEI